MVYNKPLPPIPEESGDDDTPPPVPGHKHAAWNQSRSITNYSPNEIYRPFSQELRQRSDPVTGGYLKRDPTTTNTGNGLTFSFDQSSSIFAQQSVRSTSSARRMDPYRDNMRYSQDETDGSSRLTSFERNVHFAVVPCETSTKWQACIIVIAILIFIVLCLIGCMIYFHYQNSIRLNMISTWISYTQKLFADELPS